MEDDLNILGILKMTLIFNTNGRQPQHFRQMEDNLIFLGKWKTTSTFQGKWKTTSILFWIKNYLNYFVMEVNINFLLTERRFQFKLAPAWTELGTAQPQLVFIVFHNYHNCSLVVKRRWLAEQRLLSGYESIIGGINWKCGNVLHEVCKFNYRVQVFMQRVCTGQTGFYTK